MVKYPITTDQVSIFFGSKFRSRHEVGLRVIHVAGGGDRLCGYVYPHEGFHSMNPRQQKSTPAGPTSEIENSLCRDTKSG